MTSIINKDNWIALLSSIILPGSGHFLCKQRYKAFNFLIIYLLFISILILHWTKFISAFTISKSIDLKISSICLIIFILGIWLYALYDIWKQYQKGSIRSSNQWHIVLRQFRKNHLAIIGLYIILGLYAITLLCPLLAPYDPNEIPENLTLHRYQGPSLKHWWGTDGFGRDVLTRALYGSRISLSIGFIAVAIAITLGTFVGCVSGYYGGLVDGILMRLVDVLRIFPSMFLILTLLAVYQPKGTGAFWLVIAVLGLTGWMGVSRLVRGQILSLKEEEFIQAAKALGLGDFRIIFRHILPNVMAPIIIAATLRIGGVILTEAALSFLGLGIQPPTPTWGNIINAGRNNLLDTWWISTFPGLAIVLTVVSYNLIGDGLRDALDPKLRN